MKEEFHLRANIGNGYDTRTDSIWRRLRWTNPGHREGAGVSQESAYCQSVV